MEADKVGGILDIGDHKFTLYVWVVAVLGVNHLSEVEDAGLPPGNVIDTSTQQGSHVGKSSSKTTQALG